jgi:hypothetical protein
VCALLCELLSPATAAAPAAGAAGSGSIGGGASEESLLALLCTVPFHHQLPQQPGGNEPRIAEFYAGLVSKRCLCFSGLRVIPLLTPTCSSTPGCIRCTTRRCGRYLSGGGWLHISQSEAPLEPQLSMNYLSAGGVLGALQAAMSVFCAEEVGHMPTPPVRADLLPPLSEEPS